LEYWALVWGTGIMGVTGVVLWFDNYWVERFGLGRVWIDVAEVIHYYEAWLATLAILVWHGYGTIFRPGVYPMNPSWLRGRMPADMYRHEHPGAPDAVVAKDKNPEADLAAHGNPIGHGHVAPPY
ncbi:MAG: hypothetical protein D6788_02625, partial [Planctomycetota bacterium]